MDITHNIEQIRATVNEWRQQGLTVAFVPTMGNLHQGHLTLVNTAKQHADKVVVSIFVNPMQFDNATDLQAYPRTLDQDAQLLVANHADLLFTPTPEVIYPQGMEKHTYVHVPGISELLEGALRPGHFRGVSTVVTKLFNIVQPDVACFGEKDFQQLALIRKMTTDLALPIEIIGVPTVRAESGLALSSRNGYLTPEELAIAPYLHQVMQAIADKITAGERDVSGLVNEFSKQLDAKGFKTDQIDIVDADSLLPLSATSNTAVILMAAFLGKARLIDNRTVNLHP
ncbi:MULTISPECIES: pantoate--beta-alanine ligase [unclassified Motilimonas]|uniref:pantoate--beta-alanine ligase n=1 Tax=unclassified Motilimonas TaxID=2643697 RepID=UPI001E5B38C4|nr:MULTISPECIES: pantoate--beta-alanine ligase [unclassified Motilimonas]MCE0558687.1 pantoate--beta-alanine ligase [Motilimonas sp. E26]MDO6525717.1 pantoate--beta-alanine ligase [Motilimonas sp. 1_MG-2023]